MFASYQPPSRSFDELYEPSGDLRPGWSTLGAHFEKLGIEGIEAGSKLVRRLVRQSSISDQNTMGPSRAITWFDTTHRPWQLDAIPWVLSACEWESLSDGLRQRARLLNRILVDLHGPQNLISEGKIPAEVVYSHPGFSRPFHGWSVPQSLYLHCYTADLVRTEDGAWKVVADRTDSPLGVGYALENRLVLSRTYPSIFRDTLVQRLAPFFIQLRTLLSQLSPKNQDNPRVVLLTHGPGTAGYFEDVYLARYLGYNLVESGDLTVREDRLYLKTLGGLLQVDVLFRRLSDQLCDPLEFQADASLGVPGLTRAARAGQVLVVNALGSSLVESPVFMPFLEELSTHVLGERLKIASVPTWWCGDPEQCRFVLRQPNDYMFVSGYRVGRQTIFPNLSRAQIHESERMEILRRRPSMYVAQSKFERSMVPCYRDGKIQPLYAALRVYLVADGEDYLVLPGGLGRVASENEMLEKNILQGQNSKEVWVLSEGPVPPISLLSGPTGPKKEFSRDGSELTSRVADNLLWLGRYVERADGNARLLRTTLLRLARESNVESLPEWSGLVRQLADRGLIEPGYAVKGLRERLPSLSERLPTIAIDDHQSGNLRDNLRQIVRLSSILRDRLSPDSWQTLYFLESRLFAEPSLGSREPNDAIGILSQLILDLSAFLGMSAESMTRTIGWRILDLGRRLERAIGVATVVSQLAGPECEDPAEWEALVEASDSLMTYRFRYLASWSRDAVLDLLLTDESNPRSVAFQLAAIDVHVQRLVASSHYSYNSPEKQLSSKMIQAVRQIDANVLAVAAEQPTDNFVLQSTNSLIKDLLRLSEMINARYVVHTGPVRNRGK